MKTAKCKAQQGDVTLRKVKFNPSIPYKVLSKGRCVLAEGEHTGHSHVVEDDEAQLIRQGERMLLLLGRAATVTHQEHGPFGLSATGKAEAWEVGRVQEYDYYSKMARPVQD